MRIKYQVTVDDVVAFNLFHRRHSPTARRTKIVAGVLIPAGLFLLTGLDSWHRGRWDGLIPGCVIAGLLMLWILGGDRRRVDRAVRKMLAEGRNKGSVGEHDLELTESGLIVRTEVSETTFRWAAVERLGLTPDYIFVFTGPVSAIIVPRARVAEGLHEEFEGELRGKVGQAAGAGAAVGDRALCREVIIDTERVYKEDAAFGKHSALGVASFMIAVVVGGLDLFLFLLLVVLGAIAPRVMDMGSVILHIITSWMLLGLVANVVGLGLAAAGVAAKNRKKAFSILGLILNGLILIVLIGLMVIVGHAP